MIPLHLDAIVYFPLYTVTHDQDYFTEIHVLMQGDGGHRDLS
jgi:hypothetical protein